MLQLILLPGPALCLSDDLPPEHFRAFEKFSNADFKGALPLFQVLRASYQARGDDERAGMEAHYVGAMERILGDHEKAVVDDFDAIERLRRAGDKLDEAGARREAFQALRALKRDDEAEAQIRELLRLDEETEEDDALKTDLRTFGDFQIARGRMDAALAAADRRVRLHAEDADKFGEGDARIARGVVLRAMSRRSEADREDARGRELQTESQREYQKTHGEWRIDHLKALAEEKAATYDRAASDKAWRAMLALSREKGFKNGIVIALMNLGASDDNAGDHARAAAEFAEGARLAREDGEGLNETTMTMEQGVAVANSGDLNGGLELLRRARGLAARRRDALGELATLQQMREVYGFRGDYAGTLSCNDQMLAVARRSGRKKALMAAENSVGRFYESIGDASAALDHYGRELALARALGDRSKIAEGLNETAGGYVGLDEFERAKELYRESLSMHDWYGGRVNLADTYLFLGEPEKAYGLLRPLNEWHIDLGKYYLVKNDFPRARDLYAHNAVPEGQEQDVSHAIATQTGLGLSYEGLKDYARAAEHFARAESLIDRLRESLSPAHRLYFMSTWDWQMPHLESFEGMVRVSEFLPGGLREALHHAEFTRGRLFAEAAARRHGPARSELPAGIKSEEQSLAETVSVLAGAAENAVRSNRKELASEIRSRLAKAQSDRDAFVARLRKGFPEYAAVRYPLPLYADELEMEPGEVLIEFEVTGPYTKGFVVKGGRVAFSWDVPLARADLSALVKKYRGYFEGVSGGAQLAAYDPRLGLRLYRLLLEPALKAKDPAGLPLIAADARLTIVPDEILGIVPFESLVVSAPAQAQLPAGRHGPAPVGVTYASDLYDIAYEHSATAMTITRRLRSKRSPSADLFVLADPIFNAADPRLRGTAIARADLPPEKAKTMGAVARTMGLGGSRPGSAADKQLGREDFLFPRLDRTGALAKDLQDKIFAGSGVLALVGAAANKEGLRRLDLSGYRYLVFATHGLLDNMIPGIREPALVLNQLGPGAEDGFLTKSEIMDLKLDADLVALTACQTGLGRQLTGEGVMGLGRAFQYAGARSVLVSLWSVAEDSTTLLAERFFAHLKEGKTKRQALRMARTDVRRAGYEHPFYWAPFILIGG